MPAQTYTLHTYTQSSVCTTKTSMVQSTLSYLKYMLLCMCFCVNMFVNFLFFFGFFYRFCWTIFWIGDKSNCITKLDFGKFESKIGTQIIYSTHKSQKNHPNNEFDRCDFVSFATKMRFINKKKHIRYKEIEKRMPKNENDFESSLIEI